MVDLNFSVDEIKKGYYYNNEDKCYCCMYCSKVYYEGQIYEFDSSLYESFKAIQMHIANAHDDRVYKVINSDNKYLSLTQNQKELLSLFYDGKSDADIGELLGISISTVRHQRFMFKEKAKSAKMYLSLWELISENLNENKNKKDLIELREGATMVDDRYDITNEESQKVIKNSFSSLEPLKLMFFPVKEKKKIVILNLIITKFEKNKEYTEKEVNQILKDIYYDFVTIRRYLIEYGYMDRTKDCMKYWLI